MVERKQNDMHGKSYKVTDDITIFIDIVDENLVCITDDYYSEVLIYKKDINKLINTLNKVYEDYLNGGK